jgi:hypothetical protein
MTKTGANSRKLIQAAPEGRSAPVGSPGMTGRRPMASARNCHASVDGSLAEGRE